MLKNIGDKEDEASDSFVDFLIMVTVPTLLFKKQ